MRLVRSRHNASRGTPRVDEEHGLVFMKQEPVEHCEQPAEISQPSDDEGEEVDIMSGSQWADTAAATAAAAEDEAAADGELPAADEHEPVSADEHVADEHVADEHEPVHAGELAVEPVQIGEAQALVGRDGIGRASLATFSLDTAALECGVTLDELQLMVQGQTPDRDGHTWAVEGDDFPATVVRTNLVGRVVAKYGSVAAAARSAERLLGRPVGETGMLRLMRERELVDGTHSYHEAEVFDPALLSVQVPAAHGRSRTCTQLDSNGKALRIFPSIKLAAEAACVDYSNFRKSVTSGGMVAGHRWRVAQSKGKRARKEPLSDAEEESELPEPPKQVLPSGPGGPSAAVKRPRPAASADVKPSVPSGPGNPVDPRIARLRVLMKSFESASLVGKTAMYMISLNACPIEAMDMFE